MIYKDQSSSGIGLIITLIVIALILLQFLQ